MSEHDLKLPWRVKRQTILNADDVPVAIALRYTSVAKMEPDGITYHSTDAARDARLEAIVRAVNAMAKAL